MNNLKIETFIGRQYYSSFPEVITEAVSITNPLAFEKAQRILEENEGNYLCGFVSLIYNDVVIFGEDQLTENLLDTWSDLVYILDHRYDGSIHNIIFLDNATYDAEIEIIDQHYQIHLDSSHSFRLPIEPFKNGVKKGFIAFMDFCKNGNFIFSEESLYKSHLKTYNELLYDKGK
ncbi:hypothetical protein ACIP9G_07280 [Lysinibacillus sp. NPDC093197]|uniref:hypothetical protein n=1 Tax=Lysinibacillus sp. NPDC093197 TaxID=3364132 RepID=UPI0037F5FF0E